MPEGQDPVQAVVDMVIPVRLTVNGTAHTLSVEPRRTLADVLRDELGLTGTHVGCEHGVCGACTVIVDGAAVRSCIAFAVQFDESEVETVEALADESGQLSAIQQAFAENSALQCGFCTPGFLMLTKAFLMHNPDPTRNEIRDMLASNLCRCTGYAAIIDAVEQAAAWNR